MKSEMLGGVRLSNDEGKVYHHLGISGFAEYSVVSENSIVKIDKKYLLNVHLLCYYHRYRCCGEYSSNSFW